MIKVHRFPGLQREGDLGHPRSYGVTKIAGIWATRQLSPLELVERMEERMGINTKLTEIVGDPEKDRARKRVQRRIRMLWIGFATYFLVFLNAVRLAPSVPYQVFVIGALLNIVIVVTIILFLRRAYKELNELNK